MKKYINKYIQEFPKIFRIIPENKLVIKILKSKGLYHFGLGSMVAICIALLVGSLILMISLSRNIGVMSSILNQRQALLDEVNFWQSIVEKYPAYKDAYFQIAVLEYKLGDLGKAKVLNNQALLLDPNFTDANKLKNLLNKQ